MAEGEQPPSATQWYYAENNERRGPVALEAVQELLRSGRLYGGAYVWTEGFENWAPANTVVQLQPFIPAVVPPFPAAVFATAPAATYAGFWKRFAAFVLDWIILYIPSLAISAIVGLFLPSPDFQPAGGNPEQVVAAMMAAFASGGILLAIFFNLIAAWLYYSLFESSRLQATPGKMALGIRVTDSLGARVSFGRATGRHFAKIVSGLICNIGYIMAGLTEKKQALHDMMANCLVVNKD